MAEEKGCKVVLLAGECLPGMLLPALGEFVAGELRAPIDLRGPGLQERSMWGVRN